MIFSSLVISFPRLFALLMSFLNWVVGDSLRIVKISHHFLNAVVTRQTLSCLSLPKSFKRFSVGNFCCILWL